MKIPGHGLAARAHGIGARCQIIHEPERAEGQGQAGLDGQLLARDLSMSARPEAVPHAIRKQLARVGPRAWQVAFRTQSPLVEPQLTESLQHGLDGDGRYPSRHADECSRRANPCIRSRVDVQVPVAQTRARRRMPIASSLNVPFWRRRPVELAPRAGPAVDACCTTANLGYRVLEAVVVSAARSSFRASRSASSIVRRPRARRRESRSGQRSATHCRAQPGRQARTRADRSASRRAGRQGWALDRAPSFPGSRSRCCCRWRRSPRGSEHPLRLTVLAID